MANTSFGGWLTSCIRPAAPSRKQRSPANDEHRVTVVRRTRAASTGPSLVLFLQVIDLTDFSISWANLLPRDYTGGDNMRRFSVRIGTKLALTAGVGVALVLAMIGNEVRVARHTKAMDAEVNASRTVLQAIVEIANAEQRAVVQNRSMQTASSDAEIDEALTGLNDLEASSKDAFNRALGAARPSERTSLSQAQELDNGYIAAVRDYAAVQKRYLAARNFLIKLDKDWPAKFKPVIESLAVAAAGNHDEFT